MSETFQQYLNRHLENASGLDDQQKIEYQKEFYYQFGFIADKDDTKEKMQIRIDELKKRISYWESVLSGVTDE